MTPKEKAIELINKYHSLELVELNKITDGLNIGITSKQCALISIDLALEFCGGKDINEEFDKVLYLVEVKNEIEKL